MSTAGADVLDSGEAGGKAIRGGAFRTVGYFGNLLLSLASVPFMIRHLEAADYGKYVAVSAIVFIIGGVTEAGLTNLGIREYSVLDRRERDRLLAPVRVARGAAAGDAVPVRVPEAWGGEVGWTLTLAGGEGEVVREGRGRGEAHGTLTLRLPVTPDPGYHSLRVSLRHGGDERDGEQTLIVAPRSCLAPAERVGARAAFGITANLYTVRSARRWGVGDFSALAELLRWAG